MGHELLLLSTLVLIYKPGRGKVSMLFRPLLASEQPGNIISLSLGSRKMGIGRYLHIQQRQKLIL